MNKYVFICLCFVFFLQGCQSTGKAQKKDELDYTKIIDYTKENRCRSEETKCKVGNFDIYTHSVLVMENSSKENVFIFLDSGLVQYSDSFPYGRVFYYTYNLNNYSRDDKEEKAENNELIIRFIRDVNESIK
jgi:hypothetical protein